MHALVINSHVAAKLEALRATAEANPVSFETMYQQHLDFEKSGRQVPYTPPNTDRTVRMRVGYSATFTVECHRPNVPCRHLSVSGPNRFPAPNAVALLMQMMGFQNQLLDAKVWTEQIGEDHFAVNVLEPMRDEDWKELLLPVAGTVQ